MNESGSRSSANELLDFTQSVVVERRNRVDRAYVLRGYDLEKNWCLGWIDTPEALSAIPGNAIAGAKSGKPIDPDVLP
jgi:hypothetical protein